MKNILILTGTRPEIIKMAPVFEQLRTLQGCHAAWCHTGQHDSMADQMFAFFGIHPDYVLSRPEGSSLAELTGGLLKSIDQQLAAGRWDLVCVHGDTTTTFAAALAAFYRRIPVLHVEAGLRSHDLNHPFPEESNRKLVAGIATRHYAPTRRAREALLAEGVPDSSIIVTGNTVVDAQLSLMERFGIVRQRPESPRLLVTAHRRENWEGMQDICEAIRTLVEAQPDLEVVFPVHLNPVVRNQVWQQLGGQDRVKLCEPMDYLALQRELARSTLVLTDSGGIQEEAAGFGVPCLVMRETTERPEAVEAGIARLVGTRLSTILDAALPLLRGEETWSASAGNPFGDGKAARRIRDDVRALLEL